MALHIPCNTNSKPDVDVLIGPAPNFTKVQPDIIQAGLSHPGLMCLYHADINSDPSKKIYQTDIAIANESNLRGANANGANGVNANGAN